MPNDPPPSQGAILSEQQRERVTHLFGEANDQPAEARADFLAARCPDDPLVRAKVEELLAAYEQANPPFIRPAIDDAAVYFATPPPDYSGRQIGRYRIRERLGEGGMGQVYRALTDIGKEVAVKVMPAAFADDGDWIERQEREARLLAKLRHPNIAEIYGREVVDSLRFLVLEYVPGETLAARLQRDKALPVAEALPAFRQFADGLAALHRAGLVHRDLKPSNLMLTPTGQVKVLDFGIAKRAHGEAADEQAVAAAGGSTTLSQWHTLAGSVPGTLPYMSPEHLEGDEVDARADVWAFGVMLYEALTGQHPFRRAQKGATRAAILGVQPDSAALPKETPERVRDLVRRCLEKDARRRPHDGAEVRFFFDELEAGWWPKALGTLRRPIIGGPLAAAVIGVALFVALPFSRILGRHTAPGHVTVIAGAAPKDAPCRLPTESGEVAAMLSNRLRKLQNLKVSSSDEMPEEARAYLLAASDLTQVTKSLGTWVIRVETRCRGPQQVISCKVMDTAGRPVFEQEGAGLEEVGNSLLVALNIQQPLPPEDPRYEKALADLRPYLNRESIEKAVTVLESLANAQDTAKVNAALGLAYSRKAVWAASEERRAWAEKANQKCLRAREQVAPGGEIADVALFCGEVMTANDNYQGALTAYQDVLRERPENPDAYQGLALAHLYAALAATGDEQGRSFREAEQSGRHAVTLRPDYATYNRLASIIYYQGRFADAEAYYRKADDLSFNLSPQLAVHLGATCLYQEKFPEAEKTLLNSIKRGATFDGYQALGTYYYLNGQCDKAAEAYRQGLTLSPKDPELQGSFADACRCGQTCRGQADDAYRLALALSKPPPGTEPDAGQLSRRAEWLVGAGKKREALDAADRASRDPSCGGDCLESCLKVYWLTGHKPEAFQVLALARSQPKWPLTRFLTRHDPGLQGLTSEPDYRRLDPNPVPTVR